MTVFLLIFWLGICIEVDVDIITFEILLFIGSQKMKCFADYLSCYVSLNQVLFRCSSLNLKEWTMSSVRASIQFGMHADSWESMKVA